MSNNILFQITTEIPKKIEQGTYIIRGNGIFFYKPLPGEGLVITQVEGIKGLPDCREEIRFLKKKIPFILYNKIIEFFRAVQNKFNTNLEAFIEIGYNPLVEKYFLYVPEQIVSAGSVKYNIGDFYKYNHKDCYIVLNAHSHGSIGAFFSTTDDSNDCRDQFSVVIGHINNLIPDSKVKFASGKKHFDLKLEDVFENEECEVIFDLESSLKRVKLFEQPAYSISQELYEQGHKIREIPDYSRAGYASGGFLDERYKSTYAKRGTSRNSSLYDLIAKGNRNG